MIFYAKNMNCYLFTFTYSKLGFIIFNKYPIGLKKFQSDFSQALRLFQESRFLQLNTWIDSLPILYNMTHEKVLDPEKIQIEFFLYRGLLFFLFFWVSLFELLKTPSAFY